MARSTQVVGLTSKADIFVGNLQQVESDSHTVGMFGEKIELRKWKYKHGFVREVLQDSPWSSGPMLFYCLEIDWCNGAKHQCFQWVVDPTLGDDSVEIVEIDYMAGTYWV